MTSGARAAADTCGCATGARFLAVALIGSGAWYGWQWRFAELGLGGVLVRVLIVSFAAATIGKVVGIVRARHAARERALRRA